MYVFHQYLYNASLFISNSAFTHTRGGAMDIDESGFLNQKDAVIDLIALTFGLVRAGTWDETWHFELSDLGTSDKEKEIIKKENR